MRKLNIEEKSDMKKIKININDKTIIRFITFMVLFCTYIFPLYIVDSTYVLSKLIFLITIVFSYLFFAKQLTKIDYTLIFIIMLLFIITKNYNYFTFLTLPIANIFLNYKEEITDYISNSPVIYICLICTLVYSVMFAGFDGRYAFTAIKEINQSGLAIFFLGLILLRRSKSIGIFVLVFGLLTFSRSYFLALMLMIIFRNKKFPIKLNDKIIKKLNYFVFVILTTLFFVGLAFIYIYKYKNGEIGANDNLYKFINPFDYSNLFRFAAILYTINIFVKYPSKILFGLTKSEYDLYSSQFAADYGVAFRETDPHNLFFSHLKMYGFMSIIETAYITKILSKIVNNANFYAYMAIVFYSLILGAGLYSYWLFLAIIVLIISSNQSLNLEKKQLPF